MKRLVILISGRGSNMVRIAECCRDESWPAEVVAVISNRPDAAGLQSAAAMGLPTDVIDHQGFESRDAFDLALADRIEALQADLVILAGFMRILGQPFVDRFANRLVNVHPSLLPAFPGLQTHQRALDEGVKVHGASVHYVIPELDAGPIIAQAVVPVAPDDTADTLMARVQAAEHQLYPRAIFWVLTGRVTPDGQVTRFVRQDGDPADLSPLLVLRGDTLG